MEIAYENEHYIENISKVKPILWSVNILGSQQTNQIYFLPPVCRHHVFFFLLPHIRRLTLFFKRVFLEVTYGCKENDGKKVTYWFNTGHNLLSNHVTLRRDQSSG